MTNLLLFFSSFFLQMTVADIQFYNCFDFIAALVGGKEIYADFPRLSALRRRVGQNDVIAAWVEKRPVNFI